MFFVIFYGVSLLCGLVAFGMDYYRYSFIPGNERMADPDTVLAGTAGAVIGLVSALLAALLFFRSWKIWLLTGLLFVLSGVGLWRAGNASSEFPPSGTSAAPTASE
ncbi:hypothetical protein FDA94_18765 [Herbidospora galbida]|uniref:Uncharacterized protein n=1 Tax=Herbidospora galbida TaxID=2575442 RepID=A0A4U3MEI3_9ACTN|nr:hypothetical protein [Herbidospora galbida]TKK87160.1 hypothetical protein FDA94_18765 [Herbidospora galbida]